MCSGWLEDWCTALKRGSGQSTTPSSMCNNEDDYDDVGDDYSISLARLPESVPEIPGTHTENH